MSGTENEAQTPGFTEREIQMLGWAMQSLKTPPEIDYEKLAGFAGMSNPRSASNAWAKIKAKMVFAAPVDGAVPSTPKRGRPKAKKQNAEETSNKNKNQDGEDTPNAKKPARKRAAKKQDVGGEGTPAKKRATAGKAAVVDAESDADKPDIKTEESDMTSAKDTGSPAADELSSEI